MRSSNSEPSGKSSSFWGIALSLCLHGIVLILALFWGFGTPKQLGEPQSIEGRLVSLSELESQDGGKLEPAQEPKEDEVKKEESPKVEEEKPEEKKVEIPQPEKKEPPKETKKEEPKKVEVKKEEPKKKDAVVLDSKEKEKERPKEKEKNEEKKRVAKKQEPSEPAKPTQPKEPEKKKESSFEDIRRGVLEDMEKTVTDKRRRNVIEDIEKNVGDEKQAAEANSSGNKDANPNYRSGEPGSGAVIGLFIQRIREEIKSNWKIPQTIPTDDSLRTVVVFRMDESGKVYDVIVENPSGNPAFDDFCVKAIYKAAPLTPPPPELLQVAKTEGVKVSFEP